MKHLIYGRSKISATSSEGAWVHLSPEEMVLLSTALQRYRDHCNKGRFSSSVSKMSAQNWSRLSHLSDELRLSFWKLSQECEKSK